MLGVSDGLVTNVSLILGVAGAQAGAHFVQLAGLASLVAGAASMAAGEYVSMAAQVELLQRLLGEFRDHLEAEPEHAREDLEQFIRRGGVLPATAANASKQIAMVPDRALAVYARSLGLDPEGRPRLRSRWGQPRPSASAGRSATWAAATSPGARAVSCWCWSSRRAPPGAPATSSTSRRRSYRWNLPPLAASSSSFGAGAKRRPKRSWYRRSRSTTCAAPSASA